MDDDDDLPALSRNRSKFIDGVYVSAERAKSVAERRGLCHICCEVKTHERKLVGLQWRKNPLTIKNDNDANYHVYKGYHIGPQCYSLDGAKRALGEPVHNGKKPHKRHHKLPSSSRSEASAPSKSSGLGTLLDKAPRSRRGSKSLSGDPPSQSSRKKHSDKRKGKHDRIKPRSSNSEDLFFDAGNSGNSERFDATISSRSSNSGTQSGDYLSSGYGSDAPPRKKNESRLAIEELERFVHEQRYNDFMETLSSNKNLADVVRRAFELLRNNVHVVHETMGYVFESSSSVWIKYFVDAMETNQKDLAVQREGVLTLWTLSAISKKYMKYVCKGGGLKAILSIMGKYESDQELTESCCGALECFSRNPKDGLSTSHKYGNRALTQIVEHVKRENTVGGIRTIAIRTLYNLAMEDEGAAVSVGSELSAEPLLGVIKQAKDMNSVEWSIRLLWRLLSAECISVPRFDVIEAVLVVFSGFESKSFKDAACGIISCAANGPSDEQQSISMRQTRTVAESIMIVAASHPNMKNVQLMCLEVMCSLCRQPDKVGVVADTDIVAVVVEAMDSYQEDIVLQGVACTLLFYLCEDKEARAAVASEEGITSIATAIKEHGSSISSSAEGSDLLKDAASALLTTLATSSETSDLLVRSGIISDLDFALRNEQASSMPSAVRVMVLNALSAGECVEDDTRMVGLVTEALQSAESVEEAECILAKICSMTGSSSEAVFCVLGANGGKGMDILLGTMLTYLQSEAVQRSGCGTLANIYISIPFVGKLNQRTQVSLNFESMEVESHAEREVKALVSAMKHHKSSAVVQEYACTALSNFIVGAELGGVSRDTCTPDDVVAAFAGISKNVIDVFSIHQTSAEVLTSACRLLWVIAFMNDETEMKLRGSHAITKVCEAMSKFARDDVLNYEGCGVLSTMLANDVHTEFIGSGNAVVAIFDCICSEDERLVEIASELLASTIKTVFTASNEYMEIEDSVNEAVLCMNTHSKSPSIQKSMCEFITSLVSLQDSYVKGLIGNYGGLVAITNAMTNHAKDEMVVESGCRALSSIVSGCKPSIIVEQTSALGSILMHSMNDHPTNNVVQEAVLGALCGLCAREPSFNDYIVSCNGLPQIIDTLNQHFMLEPVVVNGCSLLWVMAAYGENKKLIGRAGIRAIVNGMQAHIASSSVQKEALTALKNLATHKENKVATVEVGGVAAIVQCMWVHMNSSQIFCAACSALNNIAVDASTKKVSNVENGELTAICFGMKRFENDKEVQMCACFLLKSYCFAPSNLPLMRDEPNLASLLMAAMERFPAECQDRAYYVLQRI